MKWHILLYAVILITTISCTTNDNDISKTIEQYYKTYQERDDFEKFLGFYDEKIVLEDIINADRIEGKKALEDFFDWNNPEYKKIAANALVIYEQTIDGNRAVTSGHFTEFLWGEQKFEAMHFVTILTFNQSGKIIKQVDWINYPSNLIDYTKRKNSNEWIK
ncbi:nuclear transport factor 2 family protein [Flagellimonas sp. CMM7]|uniref:nuclear transport factor 2 family protein n=1 Tax=Flagellimonas sp. CMM7 TaxID=2654676 RepID=UPI0013D633BB|nr:nuclear transport factor 2 family protein [Flagellimonas sp. CMM7]UII80182.1 nuclear transport factor 2 family protein [Flagellimonas sp. CMM7]